MRIGTLARAVGFSPSAIRYYERVGLISAPARKNGVRHYGPDAVDELKAIRYYRSGGVRIRQLAAIAKHARGSQARYDAWSAAMTARIADLDAMIIEAKRERELLEHAVACRCREDQTDCVVYQPLGPT